MTDQADARFAGERYLRHIMLDYRRWRACGRSGSSATSGGKGLMSGVGLVEGPATQKPFPPRVGIGVRIGKQAPRNGRLIRFDPHWIAFGPPLVVTEADIGQMAAILEARIRDVLGEP